MNDHDLLEQANQLLKIKKTKEARQLLEGYLKENRSNIYGWWLYAETWPDVENRKRIWGYCLRFNPENPEALRALTALNAASSKGNAVLKEKPATRTKNSPLFNLLSGCALIIIVPLLWLIIKNFMYRAISPEPYYHVGVGRYYLYVPEAYTADKAWPIFMGIHGAGGSGLECWNLWQGYAEKEGFILVCPSIPGDGGGYYQVSGDLAVNSALEDIYNRYNVQPRMFMAGFSAGAVFVQRYALEHPGAVSGLSVLSTAYYVDGLPPVPTMIVTGSLEYDTSIAANEQLYQYMLRNGADVEYHLLPLVGHTVTDKARQLTIECFRKTIK